MKPKFSRSEVTWVSQDGKEWKVKDLTDDHLCRLLVYVDKRSMTHSFFAVKYKGYADFLREEVVRRKLQNFFSKVMGFDLYDRPTVIKESGPYLKEVASLLGMYPYEPPKDDVKK